MPINIKIGPKAIGFFWALIALLGVIMLSSGLLYTLSGLFDFDKITLTNTESISRISGGIILLIVGLVAIGAGYLGIRGKIIITENNLVSNVFGFLRGLAFVSILCLTSRLLCNQSIILK